MGNLMSYSGLVTKVRAMGSKLLTEQDFETIASMRNVPEIVEYLKTKPAYTEAFEKLDTTLYHRGNVEKVLTQSLYSDYSRIYRFAGRRQKEFLKGYWKRYEVDLINYCFRIIFNHYDIPFDLDYKKKYFDRYSQISIDRLVTSNSVEELVENLQGTEYYATLKRISNSENPTLYDFDMALEQYYFRNAWMRQRKALTKEEREIFTKDCGTKIDLLNLEWIYRAKKYYHMLPPDIYLMTIPIHYKIRIEEFKALVETANVEQFETILQSTYYGKHYELLNTNKKIEQLYKECLHNLYLSDRRKNPYSIATVNTYLFLKEEEIDKLIMSLECVRYGLTKQETLAYLGGEVQ